MNFFVTYDELKEWNKILKERNSYYRMHSNSDYRVHLQCIMDPIKHYKDIKNLDYTFTFSVLKKNKELFLKLLNKIYKNDLNIFLHNDEVIEVNQNIKWWNTKNDNLEVIEKEHSLYNNTFIRYQLEFKGMNFISIMVTTLMIKRIISIINELYEFDDRYIQRSKKPEIGTIYSIKDDRTKDIMVIDYDIRILDNLEILFKYICVNLNIKGVSIDYSKPFIVGGDDIVNSRNVILRNILNDNFDNN
jgi:hypothetical protein